MRVKSVLKPGLWHNFDNFFRFSHREKKPDRAGLNQIFQCVWGSDGKSNGEQA